MFAHIINNEVITITPGFDELTHEENLIALNRNEEEGVWEDCTAEYEAEPPAIGMGWIRETENGPWVEVPDYIVDRVITLVEFIELFNPEEFMAIETLMTTNANVRQLYKIAEVQQQIDMDDPRVDFAFDIFVLEGIMDEDRKNDILASIG